MTTSRFSDLEVRLADPLANGGTGQWELTAPLVYESDMAGRIEVPVGFSTDFASVPRLPLAFMLAGDTAHASAVVHDYLCRVWIPRGDITWREAADVFDEAMQSEGVPGWRRMLMRWAVTGADPANKWEQPE
jgi:hypothetical protein